VDFEKLAMVVYLRSQVTQYTRIMYGEAMYSSYDGGHSTNYAIEKITINNDACMNSEVYPWTHMIT